MDAENPLLFDAFQRRLKVDQFYGMSAEFQRYYRRAIPEATPQTEDVQLHFHGGDPPTPDALKKSLYVRSAYRHDPSFQKMTIGQQQDVLDRHAVRRLIDTDQTVQNNYQRIVWRLLSKVTTPGLTTDRIMSDTIGNLQKVHGGSVRRHPPRFTRCSPGTRYVYVQQGRVD